MDIMEASSAINSTDKLCESARAALNDESTATSSAQVAVNQPALMDKILARYASEHAVYRELLANSNDAEATSAEIHLTILPSDEKKITQVVYRNNGMIFREQDWDRLTKIAEGNPDVRKVGAFGVGAYSMFSLCEEPVVVSGNKTLIFQWKGDALFAKTASIESANDEWTCFIMPMRDPLPRYDWVKFGQFLCSTLTFASSLCDISVWENDSLTMRISKEQLQEPAVLMSSPYLGEVDTIASPRGIFLMSGPVFRSVHKLIVQAQGQTSWISTNCVSAWAETTMPKDMADRMEQTMKKPPPPQVNLQMMQASEQTPKSSTTTTASRDSQAARITRHFCSTQAGYGKIFIGFNTSQTTGFNAHMFAPFVPTVEREAMDLHDTTLKKYNLDLLFMCGALMRINLEQTMVEIGKNWMEKASNKKKNFIDAILQTQKPSLAQPTPEEQNAILLAESVRLRESTPEPLVGETIASGFDECFPGRSQPVLTCSGAVPANEARMPFLGLETLVEKSVILPAVLPSHTYVRGISCLPVGLEDLRESTVLSPVLDELQLAIFLIWWVDTFSQRVHNVHNFSPLMRERIRFAVSGGSQSRTAQDGDEVSKSCKLLSDYALYTPQGSPLTSDLPLPDRLLPMQLQHALWSHGVKDKHLEVWCQPYDFKDWVTFVSRHVCFRSTEPEDVDLRVQILVKLSEEFEREEFQRQVRARNEKLRRARARVSSSWLLAIGLQRRLPATGLQNRLPAIETQGRISSIGDRCRECLHDVECIPIDATSGKLRPVACPSHVVLRSVGLVALEGHQGRFHRASARLYSAGVSEGFLRALGVKGPLEVASTGMSPMCDVLEELPFDDDAKAIIAFLQSQPIGAETMEILRSRLLLPAENCPPSERFAPINLFFPSPGLSPFPCIKVLSWPKDEVLDSKSEKFLRRLGVRDFPHISELLKFVSEQSGDWDSMMKYLALVCSCMRSRQELQTQYRESKKSLEKLTFLPCVKRKKLGEVQLEQIAQSPDKCFSKPGCQCLGFCYLDPHFEATHACCTMFQCPQDPDISDAIKQLTKMVAEASQRHVKGEAEKIAVLSTFREILDYLSTRFIPEAELTPLRTLKFIPCDLGPGEGIQWCETRWVLMKDSEHKPDSVISSLFHFVEPKPFFAALGIQKEPTPECIFDMLIVASPAKVLEKLGSEEIYRKLLRRIASIDLQRNPDIKKQLQETPMFICYSVPGEETAGIVNETLLKRAEEVYIVDNSFFGRLFNVDRAPNESDLEELYAASGAKLLSKAVKKSFRVEEAGPDAPSPKDLASILSQRRDLLVSPHVTSRQVVPNARARLEEVEICGAASIVASYSMGEFGRKIEKRHETTCCVKRVTGGKRVLYVTEDFDWYDVGQAIGEVIFMRCHLDDAFFIGALLEAPLELLKKQGFPVERILVRNATDLQHPEIKSEDELEDTPANAIMSSVTNVMEVAQSAAARVSGAAQARTSLFSSSSWLPTNLLGTSFGASGLSEPLLDDE